MSSGSPAGVGRATSVVLRVASLALLLLLVLVAVLAVRTLTGLPDTTIYLVRDDGATMTIEAVHRRLRPVDLADAGRLAVEALAQGPEPDEAARGLVSEVPGGTRVRSVRVADGVLVVDLSAEVVSGGGSASMIGRLAQLRYTLTEPTSVDAVEVTVEGRRLEAWGGEGVMVRWPWRRPDGAAARW